MIELAQAPRGLDQRVSQPRRFHLKKRVGRLLPLLRGCRDSRVSAAPERRVPPSARKRWPGKIGT
jgi:hypothetical protein